MDLVLPIAVLVVCCVIGMIYSGGFFSVSYPNLLTGLACGRTMTFGRRAGMLAATGQA